MKLLDPINIQDRSVEVYLGGPGFGEGVFIKIGKTIGIGIDCCSSFVQSRDGNDSFIDKKIQELPADGALLWVLTHFHYDHYHGLASLLGRISEKLSAVLFPLDYTPADVAFLVEQRKEFPNSQATAHRAKQEYKLLRKLVQLPPFDKRLTRTQGFQQWLGVDLQLGSEVVRLGVQICSSTSDVYDENLAKSIENIMDNEKLKSRQHANRGSYIVHCRVENFEGLFLGDAGTERIDQLVDNGVIGSRGVDCLKVGHHGSLDATNEELLKLCACREDTPKDQHALIAPYKTAGLPNEETITLLKDFGYKVHVTNAPNADKTMDERVVAEGGCVTNVGISERTRAGSDILRLNFEF